MVMNKTKLAVLSISLLLVAPVYTENNDTKINETLVNTTDNGAKAGNEGQNTANNKENDKNKENSSSNDGEKSSEKNLNTELKNNDTEKKDLNTEVKKADKEAEAKKAWYTIAGLLTIIKSAPKYGWDKVTGAFNSLIGLVKKGYNWVTGAPTAEQLDAAKALALNPEAKNTFKLEKDANKSFQEILELLGQEALTQEQEAKAQDLLKATELGYFKSAVNVIARVITIGAWSPFESKEVRAIRASLIVKANNRTLSEAIAADKAVNDNIEKAKAKKSLEAKDSKNVETIARFLKSQAKPVEKAVANKA